MEQLLHLAKSSFGNFQTVRIDESEFSSNFYTPYKMNGNNAIQRETRRLRNLVRSNVRFRTTTNSNGSQNRLKEGPNANYSHLPNNYLNRLANRLRQRQTQRRRLYNNAAAMRTGEAIHRAATRNTNMAHEIKQEFVRNNYTPAEEDVYMNAVHRYGPRNRASTARYINASNLSNYSKRRLRNILQSNRAIQGLQSASNPRFIHPEWVPAE